MPVPSPVFLVVAVLVFLTAAVLLTSIGGAGIAASPVTLPLMYLLVRARPTRPFRVAGVVIGTALEAGWGVGYVVLGMQDPGALLLGLGAAGAAGGLFAAIPSGHGEEPAPEIG